MGWLKKSKPKDYFDDIDAEYAAVARGIDSQQKRQRSAKLRRRAVYAAALSGVLSLPLWMVTILTQPEVPDPVPPTLTSPGKSEAMTEVSEWINADPSPLPGGRLQSWDGFRQLPEPDYSEDEAEARGYEKPGYSIEVHTLTVLDKDNRPYRVEVQVAVDPASGNHVIGSPSLIPEMPSTVGFNPDSPWPGMSAASNTPSAVTTAINAWTTAFASGNPDNLRLAVGDPDTEHTYVPLTGVAEAQAEVLDAAYFTSLNSEGDVVEEDRMLARVSLKVRWDGQVIDSGDDKVAPRLTYDLLVHDVNTAAPRVVAWSGPGGGQELKPYSNAVTGRGDISEDLIKTPESGETETPSLDDPGAEEGEGQEPAEENPPPAESDESAGGH